MRERERVCVVCVWCVSGVWCVVSGGVCLRGVWCVVSDVGWWLCDEC